MLAVKRFFRSVRNTYSSAVLFTKFELLKVWNVTALIPLGRYNVG